MALNSYKNSCVAPTYKLRLLHTCLALCTLLIAITAYTSNAYAQKVLKVLEITNAHNSFSIGPYSQKLSTENDNISLGWGQKAFIHSDLLQQENKNNKKLIKLDKKAQLHWIKFTVQNNTANNDFSLHMGTLFQGRIGGLTSLKIIGEQSEKVFVNWSNKNKKLTSPEYIQLKIPANSSETFYIRASSNGLLPFQISPQLIVDKSIPHNILSSLISKAINILSFLTIGASLMLITIYKDRFYLNFILFFSVNIALFNYSTDLTYQHGIYSESIEILLCSLVALGYIAITSSLKKITYSLVAVIVLLLVSAIMFISIYAYDAAQFKLYAAGIIISIIISTLGLKDSSTTAKESHLITIITIGYIIGFSTAMISASSYSIQALQIPFLQNLYFISLIPLNGVFAYALIIHQTLLQDKQMAQLNQKRRSIEALARLQQSKDSADQARLLRIIERERELMSELREKELDRAQDMRIAKENADAANEAKSAFLAVVSHEIRTPMNGIMGILKLLQDLNPTKEQSDFLLTMQKTGQTMVALLNDILDFEKIENGSMDLEKINIDLHALIKGIVTLMQGYIGDKDLKLLSEISPDIPRYVYGDPTRLQQVFMNLTSNALKFTEQGSVTIRVEADHSIKTSANNQHQIIFSIVDTGIGISEEAQQNLFQPFKQADKSTSRKYGGTGLGLAICQRLIKAMGSSIKIESTLGSGTRFYFSLALEESHESQSASSAAQQNRVASDLPSLSIVIVEDNDINRKVLQALLQKDGHKITAFSSAEEMLKNIGILSPDVMLTDINLTGMSGLEATKQIRQQNQNQYIKSMPIIGLTGNVRPQDLEDMRTAGLNGALAKPIDQNKLNQALRQIAANKKLPQPEQPKPTEQTSSTDIKKTDLTAEKLLEESKQHENAITQSDANSTPDIEKETQSTAPFTHTPQPKQPTPTSPKLDDGYNTETFINLAKSLGKNTFSELVIGCFEQIDVTLDSIHKSDQKKDPQFINARMHEIKGMCYNFGLQRLGDLAAKGEKLSSENNMIAITEILEEINKTKETQVVEIHDIINKIV